MRITHAIRKRMKYELRSMSNNLFKEEGADTNRVVLACPYVPYVRIPYQLVNGMHRIGL